jgi:hypothetical protein
MSLRPTITNEAFLSAVLDASPDCVKVVEIDGTLVYMNENGRRAMEIDDFASVCGRGWHDLWPADSADRIRSAVIRAAAGETVRFEAPCPTARGKPRWWDVVAAPLRDDQGRIERIVSISRDITDRKEVERTLRLALDAGALATWDWTVATGEVAWSDRHFTMLGYARDEVTPSYEAWAARLHPQDRAETERRILAAVEGGTTYRHEFRFRHPDGTVVWCEAEALVERDAAGAATRMLGVMRDVTDRKAAEEALAHSRERLASVLSSTDDGVIVLDGAWRVILLNERARTLLPGGSALAGRPLWDALPELVEGPWWEACREVARTGEPRRAEQYWPAHDAWFEANVFPSDGDLAVFLRDVTDRRVAEARLRDLNASLERRVAEAIADRDRTWNNAQDLLLVIERGGTIRAANPAWESILGWQPHELVGRTYLDVIHPDDHAPAREALATAGEGTLPSVDLSCLHRAGGVRRIAWVAAPEGDLIFASGRDVTAEREQAEALARAQEALRQAQRMEALGQLTGGVAHDFNNLLAVITANLEVLEGSAAHDPRMIRAIRNAMRGAERGATLTQRLLAFARKQDLRTEPVNVGELVRGLSDMLADTVGRGVRVETRLPAGVPDALVDPSQLELALLNLAVNARDAMPRGGLLAIELDAVAASGRMGVRGNDYVRIRVTDTGDGMDEPTLRRAVEPFFTTKPVGRGTGLGLSMIHGLAAQSGGAFGLESAPGRGTTAEILLPAAPTPAPPSPGTPPPVSGSTTRKLLVLLIDDDLAVLEGMAALVDSLGHVALRATSGERALGLLAAFHDIDVVVTDVAMPGLDGPALARRIAADRPGLPVVLASGRPDHETGGLPSLTKPVRRDGLAAMLARVAAER